MIRMNQKRRITLLLGGGLLNLFLLAPLPAQDVATAHLDESRRLFIRHDYAASRLLLQQFLAGNPSGSDRQEAEYMLACTAHELQEPDGTEQLQAYLERYPDTPYANRIQALIATEQARKGRWEEALDLFHPCDLSLLATAERDLCTYQMAMAYLKTGRIHEATVWFDALGSYPNPYQQEARYQLAYIDYTQGRYEQALPVMQSLQDEGDYRPLVSYYIGEMQLRQNQYVAAEATARRFLSDYPEQENRAEMNRILGQACYHQQKYQEAVQALQRYVQVTAEPKREAGYLLAMAYYHTAVYSRAAEAFGRLTSPRDGLAQNAYLHAGLSYLQLQDKHKARTAFEQASLLHFDPQVEEEALYNYALCVHETAYSPFAESVTVFERFLNRFPSSTHASQVSDYLVEVYMNTRSYEAALRSIAQIAKPDARILGAKQKILFQLGTQSFANARFAEAIDYFDRSLQLARYDLQTRADALYWRGESYYRLNRLDEAKRDFRAYLNYTSVKYNDMYALAHYNLGYIHFRQKDYASASRWFGQYAELRRDKENNVLADAYNRLGDCYFHNRRFADAQQCYAQAVRIDASLGDYSLYQEAFVLGLQKDYPGKIQLLGKLISEYPASPYLDEAYYERGRAYVMMEDNGQAIESFRQLLARFPETAIARKGASEIGLLYYQDDRYQEAIQAYKYVIGTYPGSEEARLAQRDLKSIYVDLDQVDAYAEFAASIPGGTNFESNERDSLTYAAAEKVYMRGETAQAKRSLTNYLQQFPTGAFSLNAHYYLGLIGYNQKDYAEALSHLEQVVAFPDNKFSEESMLLAAEIRFNQQDYAGAGALYKQLKEKASTTERRRLAQTGILRSAHLAADAEGTILAASDLLADSKLTPELATEARYFRAKAYLARQDVRQAQVDLADLASDTRHAYGAEAKYLLAQSYYDEGRTEKAEQEVLDYIERSTPHTYWLARSFILLSDVYYRMGRTLEAKQYLLSLQQNYQGNDDIAARIAERLDR